jgi:4-hydroxybenzoate polyprenyltransferase
LLVSSRPISWVNTAFPFAAAYFFLGGELNQGFWITTLFFLIPYNFLMYGINDVFDYESDLRNPRKGGVEGALLPPELHRTTLLLATAISLPFVAYICFLSLNEFPALIIFVLTLFFVVAYSMKGLRFKEIPFLDSTSSSIHFVGPLLYALTLLQAWNIWIAIGAVAFFIWGAASHAFGAVQDIKADREAGIASIATVLGARKTIRVSFALYLLAGLILLFLPDRFTYSALAVVPYLLVIARSFSVTDENCEEANRGWRLFLALNFIAGAIITSLLIGPM